MSRDFQKFAPLEENLDPFQSPAKMNFWTVFLFLSVFLYRFETTWGCNGDLFESSSCRCITAYELRCAFASQELCREDQTFEDLTEITVVSVEGDICEHFLAELAKVRYRSVIFTSIVCPPTLANCR